MSGYGTRLIELRGKIPQAQVAFACEISQKALSAYENETRNPRDEVKKKLARYYGCKVADIFYPDDHEL